MSVYNIYYGKNERSYTKIVEKVLSVCQYMHTHIQQTAIHTNNVAVFS